MSNEIVVVFFMLLIVFIELRSYFERKNLLDRIMAKDLTDLTSAETQRKVKIPRKFKSEDINI